MAEKMAQKPAPKNTPKSVKVNEATAKLEKTIRTLKIITTVSILIGLSAILIALYPFITAALKGPSPNFGHTIAGINNPLNSTALAVINNASNNYFERAGEMYLNHTLNNSVGALTNTTNTFVINGKPSIIYLGAISCIFCGENRWAMALALGRFGKFNNIYVGYSSFGDGDLPTLYWLPASYNASSGVNFGNEYSSSYLNFYSIEYISPITKSFQMQSLPYFQQQAAAKNLSIYENVTNLIVKLNSFTGTPYTVWGNTVVLDADASDFGNSTPTNSTLPLTYMTHSQVLKQLAQPNDQFAYTEYAAADLYIAMACATLHNSAPVCSLPAIQQIETLNKY